MNKTTVLVSLTAGLALAALALGLPRLAGPTHPASPVPPARVSTGSLTMTSRLSHPYITPGSTDLFVTVDLTGQEVPGARRTPVNLALVIDRSGSMSGYKLQQAKQAAYQLVGMLGPEDRLALVHYGSDVKSLPALAATPDNRQKMTRFIDTIWDDGGTNIGAGLQEGRASVVAARDHYAVNRIILVSDGQPTEGITEEDGLTQLVRSIRAEGISVSSLGVGTDFNENLMQRLAEYGSGAYGFIEDAGQLASIFQKDLRQATTSVARDVVLSFTLPEGVVLGEVLGYRAHPEGRSVRVPLPDFSSGQVERVVARLTVRGAQAGQAVDVSGLTLAYTDLLQEKGVTNTASLSAMVTQQREEVLARQDKEATVYATRALSAKNMERAAEALRDGRRQEAQGYLQQNQELFQQAATVASPAAVAEDLAEQKAVMDDYAQATDGEAVGTAVKRSKSKAMRGYGKLGSTY